MPPFFHAFVSAFRASRAPPYGRRQRAISIRLAAGGVEFESSMGHTLWRERRRRPVTARQVYSRDARRRKIRRAPPMYGRTPHFVDGGSQAIIGTMNAAQRTWPRIQQRKRD